MKIQYFVCLLLLIGCNNAKKANEPVIKYIETATFKDVAHMNGDSVAISEIISPAAWKISDNNLIIYSPKNKDGILNVFSLPDFNFLNKYGRIGHGPEEFIAVNWANTSANNHLSLYDIPKKKIYTYEINDSIRKINTCDFPLWEGPICKPYNAIQEINDSIYLLQATMPDTTELELMNVNNGEIIHSFYPMLNTIPGMTYGIFFFKIAYHQNNLVFHYEFINRLEIYRIDSNNMIQPRIVIGNDKHQNETFEQSSYDGLITYYSDAQCTKDNIFALFQGKKRSEIDHSIIDIYDYDGKPVKRLILDQYINRIIIDEARKLIYANNPRKGADYIYIYNIEDII